MRTSSIAALLVLLLTSATSLVAQVTDYIVGAQDVLTIKVFDQDDLSGRFTVEADGTFTFPLIGRVKAGGLTLRAVETELKTQLANGYFRNPHVSVTVEQYKSQRIFVMGEVQRPGPQPLTGNMTLIEALAVAGSTTDAATGEALIVRAKPGTKVSGPTFPDQEDTSEVIRIDIRELQSGKLSQNAQLQDNDTIFIPRAEAIFVFGQVKNPNAYPIQRGMTVLQALSVAGGMTERGASGRIKIVRLVNGKRTELKAKLEDLVKAGDTIIVPERFF
jgi:polysaccharide biosynthesis/export protein